MFDTMRPTSRLTTASCCPPCRPPLSARSPPTPRTVMLSALTRPSSSRTSWSGLNRWLAVARWPESYYRIVMHLCNIHLSNSVFESSKKVWRADPNQCCGAETICFRSGSGSNFQKVSAPAPAAALATALELPVLVITDFMLKGHFSCFNERKST